MKKLLLFTCVISLLIVTSCSRDTDSTEVSLAEKEYLVKQALIEFNKSAIKTGKYDSFINKASQKSAVEELSPAELEALLQDFLGDQTQAFLNVYYQLEALNLTSEEFHSIASNFVYLQIYRVNLSKDRAGCCEIGENAGGSLGNLILFACSCDANGDENQK